MAHRNPVEEHTPSSAINPKYPGTLDSPFHMSVPPSAAARSMLQSGANSLSGSRVSCASVDVQPSIHIVRADSHRPDLFEPAAGRRMVRFASSHPVAAGNAVEANLPVQQTGSLAFSTSVPLSSVALMYTTPRPARHGNGLASIISSPTIVPGPLSEKESASE